MGWMVNNQRMGEGKTVIKQTMFLAAVLLGVSPVWAVNKCTGADGKVVYQDAACSNASKSSEQVKTWTNSGYVGQRGEAGKSVEPNTKLEGPPQAAPLSDLYRRWADTERLALSTSRIALSGPTSAMQALRREAEAMKVPQCLAAPHKSLTALVTKSTEALLQFMGKEELTGMVYQVVDRRKLIPEFEQGIASARCE